MGQDTNKRSLSEVTRKRLVGQLLSSSALVAASLGVSVVGAPRAHAQLALTQTYNCPANSAVNPYQNNCTPPDLISTTTGDAIYATINNNIDSQSPIYVTTTLSPSAPASGGQYANRYSTAGDNSAVIHAYSTGFSPLINGGPITIASNVIMSTRGLNSPGILAQSVGRTGYAGSGTSGGTGGGGSTVTVTSTNSISTSRNQSPGIFALSQGGVGGKGGDGTIFSSGSSGGTGGVSGLVSVTVTAQVITGGDQSDAIRASSLSGAAGDGGGGVIFSGGGSGGQGSPAGGVSVKLTSSGPLSIYTLGNQSNGIAASSVGGFAGTGGSGGYFVPSGGSANSGGNGGAVSVTTTESTNIPAKPGSFMTYGIASNAILAQSVGGGGGYGGAAGGAGGVGGAFGGALGASGGAGGSGGNVTVSNQMLLSVIGNYSRGIFAQSVGGGGGDGGSAAGINAYGGSGAGGGSGGNVTVNNQGSIHTGTAALQDLIGGVAFDPAMTQAPRNTHLSYGILAQSVGGGGGTGGDASGAAAYGGSGGSGGSGGAVTVTNSALRSSDLIQTGAKESHGIFAQSVGGGGGAGGDAAGAISFGGSGGGGSASGGIVQVINTERIYTLGINSTAIFAQSVGGGGGAGGNASGAASFGGSGGPGGSGGYVSVHNSALLQATGAFSHGLVAQSIGGGGGMAGQASGALAFGATGGAGANGGAMEVVNTGDLTSNGTAILAQSVGGGGGSGSTAGGLASIGGRGGGGGAGGQVFLRSVANTITIADDASALVAQSIGGGGGSGGGSSSASALALTLGGTGGLGGAGGVVDVHLDYAGSVYSNNQAITTQGKRSDGVQAQSIGGGGGNGGNTVAGSLGGSVAIGGEGGGGGAGGDVGVTAAGTINTNANDSRGIFAQSIGGGGGNGGFALSGSVSINAGYSLAMAIGGSGGSGGNGGYSTVEDFRYVNNPTYINTSGDRSSAVVTQSVGGGGGAGGASLSLSGGFGISIGVGLGGSGGSGGDAGQARTSFGNFGQSTFIVTSGKFADGILTQSIGGGGGVGGITLDGAFGSGGSGVSLALGGSGGSGGRGVAAETDFRGEIKAHLDGAAGIVTQSIGGGGGNGGAAIAASAGATSFAGAIGGTGGVAGDAGAATVKLNQAAISTDGTNADAVLGQSIGGGGGNGGASFAGSAALAAPTALAIGGKGGDGGLAGQVAISAKSVSINTSGALSSGLVAQSIGGGGGNGGIAAAGNIAVLGAGLSIALGGRGGAGGVGAAVSVTLDGGSVTTSGTAADGILAQSIGGGGGNGGLAGALGLTLNGGAVALGLGGTGGNGAHSDQVSVNVLGNITTQASNAGAVLTQSIGGGGGNGGATFTATVSDDFSGSLALGGSGGSGAASGGISVNTNGVISTRGAYANGVTAQSIGGGGGNGGEVIAGSFSVDGALAATLGGTGATGGSVSVLDPAGRAPVVAVTSTGTISTAGTQSHGLLAQSIGGGGGAGGYAISAGVSFGGSAGSLAIGGNGGSGGFSGQVNVNASGSISTTGTEAAALVAQSIGGGGGDGGFAAALAGGDQAAVSLGLGGKGGSGNRADNVTITSSATITSSGALSGGILGQSIGGGGGNGGFALAGAFSADGQPLGVGLGGAGGGGDVAGAVTVTATGQVTTRGALSTGIAAQSIGGGGGNGGFSGALSASVGGSAAAALSVGGSGGGGENAGAVTLTSTAGALTYGDGSHALVAQSIGGGGGNGGMALAFGSGRTETLALAVGGAGGSGGTGNTVTASFMVGVSTAGTQAYGLLAQSIGGGGGDGGLAIAGSLNNRVSTSVGLGGKGGDGQTAGAVMVNANGAVLTQGAGSHGIVAQSIGGGGGAGGIAGAVSLGVGNSSAAVNLAVGGKGGTGGLGAAVTVIDGGYGTFIETRAANADGILAQSIGGGGGDGGFALAASADTNSKSFNLAAALGGSGGSGNAAGAVSVTTSAPIDTSGSHSNGVVAQSIGGGGGNGGFAASGIVATGSDSYRATLSLGGSGGSGGAGGAVSLASSLFVSTSGDDSTALLAQSIGGGGGNGGLSITAGLAGANSTGDSFALGGSGGSGNVSGAVSVTASGEVYTFGARSIGVQAQSIGGGGGNGGLSVVGLVARSQTFNDGVSLGGVGGTGNNASAVTVSASGLIQTKGDAAYGIEAQSIGGGGGDGGLAVAASFSGTDQGQGIHLGASAAVGGAGGNAGNSGSVNVTTSALMISTSGRDARGILAQSIGGGGGNGGLAVAGSIARGGDTSNTYRLNLAFGGTGGMGGLGGRVQVSGQAIIATSGDNAAGVYAQSVGGGGGNGGGAIAALIGLNANSQSRKIDVTVALGGNGGKGNNGGSVSVSQGGTIATSGAQSDGIFAQSVGGGGGVGGQANSINFEFGASCRVGDSTCTKPDGTSMQCLGPGEVVSTTDTVDMVEGTPSGEGCSPTSGNGTGNPTPNPGKPTPTPANQKGTPDTRNNLDFRLSMGGSGGESGAGADVTVNSTANIQTSGELSNGIFAQSVGGGGGRGGLGASGLSGLVPAPISVGSSVVLKPFTRAQNKSLTIALGGSGGASGDGGIVNVSNTGQIKTAGFTAYGLFAQSVGGGGGVGGVGDAGVVPGLKLGGGGDGGNAGNGGRVSVTNSGSIATLGQSAKAIVVQSIGGGGGVGGTATSGGVALGGSGGNSGSGSDVTVTNSAALVMTSGDTADAIFAQSVGGGGGIAESIGTFDSVLQSTKGLIALGGSGVNSGNGGTVSVENRGTLATTGYQSAGIVAQSTGGGGGDGASTFGALALGGSGGDAGLGGNVTVNSRQGATISTIGLDSYGILALSNGGGGGRGGNGNTSQTFGLSAGSNAGAGQVSVTNDGAIRTQFLGAHGIVAQSIGGGGGISGDGSGQTIMGAAGPGSERGSTVTVNNNGQITTNGFQAMGILAQSVGGGGGVTAMIQTNQKIQFGATSGGDDSGNVNVTSAGTIGTSGLGAFGVFAQSVGGGGGLVLATNLAENYTASNTSRGTGGAVTFVQSGTIATSGPSAHGAFLESIGGGGGLGGGLDSYRLDPPATAGFNGSAGGTGDAGQITATVNGSISTSGSKASAIELFSLAGKGSGNAIRLTVNGTLQATGAGSDAIIARSAGTRGGQINLSISATGRVVSGSGYAAWLASTGTINADNQGFLSGSVAGGAISLKNGASATFNAGTDLATSAGSLDLQNSGILNVGPVGTIQKSAMTGSLTQYSTGSLGIDIDGSTATGDLLQINGNANLAGKITVNLLNFAHAKPGDHTVPYLTTTGTLTTSGLTLVRPASALVDVRLAQPDSKSLAIFYGVDFAPDTFGLGGNLVTLGHVFDDLQEAGNSDVFNVVAPRFFEVGDSDALAAVYNQLSGEGAIGVQEAAFRASRQFTQSIKGEMRRWVEAPASVREGHGLWGTFAREAETVRMPVDGSTASIHSQVNSWTLGLDRSFGSFLVGGAIGYDYSTFAVAERQTWGAANGFRGAAYAGWKPGRFYISGSTTVATYYTHMRRTIAALGLVEGTRANVAPFEYGGQLEVGRAIRFKALTMTPFAAITAVRLHLPDFTEIHTSGADAFGLDYMSRTARRDETNLGMRIASRENAALSFHIDAVWLHDLASSRQIDARFATFGSDVFTIGATVPERDRARIDAGVEARLGKHLTFHASYQGEVGPRTRANAEVAGLSMEF